MSSPYDSLSNAGEDHQSVAGEGSNELLMTQSTSQPNVSDDEVPDEDFAFQHSKGVIHNWLNTQNSTTVRMQEIIAGQP